MVDPGRTELKEKNIFFYREEGKKPVPLYNVMVDAVRDKYKIITFTDTENSWVYDKIKGTYSDDAIPLVKAELMLLLGNEFKKTYSEETIYQLKIKTYVNRENVEPPEQLFPCANGLLDINIRELRPHTPSYFFTNRSETIYNPNAVAPKFLQFLEEVECPKMDTIQEFCGYLMLNSPRFKKAIFLYGPTDSGKTTFSNAIFNVIGHENTCSIPIQSLDRRFQEQRLYQKRANVVGDLGSEAFKNVSMFKRTTGGDIIEAEVKGANKTIKFVWTGKHWFDANDLPDPKGDADTDAFYNRLILAAFSKQIPKDQQNKKLPDELIEERSGILNWMLDGLDRLEENEGFTDKTEITEIREHYKRASNNVYCFAEDRCTIKQGSYIHKGEAFRLYAAYCIEQGFSSIGKGKFYEQLQTNLPSISSEKKPIESIGLVHVFQNVEILDADLSKISTISTLSTLPPPANPPIKTLQEYTTVLSLEKEESGEARNGYGEIVEKVEKVERDDMDLIESTRKYLKNNGGKAKTEDIVKHLMDNGYSFDDFKRLKDYTSIFTMEQNVMELVDNE